LEIKYPIKPQAVIFESFININVFQLKTHHAAWPFLKPVDINDVPDYYDHIKYPMGQRNLNNSWTICLTHIINIFPDLKTMETRLKNFYYVHKRLFIADMNRIVTNCRLYNSPETEYFRSANLLEKFFQAKMKEVGLMEK
jgi:histone acetyltransferase